MFLKDYILRESCYNCHFSNTNRVSDITMGDFWGISKSIKDFDDGRGVSLIIVNTNKGLDIFNKIKDKFYIVQSDITSCLQQNLIKPTNKPKENEIFWKTYKKSGYKRATRKIKTIYFFKRVKNKIKRTFKIRGKLND